MSGEFLCEADPSLSNGFILSEYVSDGSLHNITQYGLGTGELTFVHVVEPSNLPKIPGAGWSLGMRFEGEATTTFNQPRNSIALQAMGRAYKREIDPSNPQIKKTKVTVAAFAAVGQVRATIFEKIPEADMSLPLLVEYPPGGRVPIEFCMDAYKNRQRAVSATIEPFWALHDRFGHALEQLTPPGFLGLTAKIAEHNLKSGYKLTPADRERVGFALDGLQDIPLLDPRIFNPELAFREPRQDPLQETIGMLDALVYEPDLKAVEVLGADYADELVTIFADASQRIATYAAQL